MRQGFFEKDSLATEPTLERAAGRREACFWRTLQRQIFACLLVAALAFASFHFFSRYVLQSVQVVGVSMTPTLHDSERYVLNRFVYHVRDPKTKEIVVLRDPLDNSYAIKRIVAQQGDSVHIKGGKIYVNGTLLDEPYLPVGTQTFPHPQFREQFVICGAGKYFVLGDNRNNSSDSRNYGVISRQNILGLVVP